MVWSDREVAGDRLGAAYWSTGQGEHFFQRCTMSSHSVPKDTTAVQVCSHAHSHPLGIPGHCRVVSWQVPRQIPSPWFLPASPSHSFPPSSVVTVLPHCHPTCWARCKGKVTAVGTGSIHSITGNPSPHPSPHDLVLPGCTRRDLTT